LKKEMIVRLHHQFEDLSHKWEETGTEFWLARDLMDALGYLRWENFQKVIDKAVTSCKNAGYDPGDHFLDVTKKVVLGSGAVREIDDIALTRYACYLIAQNGDPGKEPIAFAQTYFAVQTRKQEIIEERLAEMERIDARRKLSSAEKELSGIIFERLGDGQSFGRIRSKGDRALFGGYSTVGMKTKLNLADNRALADFLPTITIKAKDFATEITNFNIKRDELNSEQTITEEHVKNNEDVRKVLTDRGIYPEKLPPAEDIKKIERKVISEQKKLPRRSEKFHDPDPE
jgi:DNA-damage-inducible protein D